ncbi:MAG: N-acetylmuramoyl-L-alanine amidase family protein, partial [Candidatus Eiseniibacteriota bacterium]
EKRRLEAEALFLGLARYFARQVPVIETFAASPYFGAAPVADSGVVTSRLMLTARISGAFDQVNFTIDGERIAPRRLGAVLDGSPLQPMPMGLHETRLSVGLAATGTARTRVLHFRVANAASKVIAEFPDQPMWVGEQPLGLRVRVLDQDGLIYGDSVRVRVRDMGTIHVSPADTELVLPRGEGWVYFRLRSWPKFRRGHPVPDLAIRAELWPTPRGEFGSLLVEPTRATLATSAPSGYVNPTRTGFAISMPADTAIRNAPGTGGDDRQLHWINADGFVRLYRDSAGDVRVPRLRGYRPWPTEHQAILAPRDTSEAQGFVPVPAAEPEWPPRFVAIAGGALHGRRIVIDPAGGGEETAGLGVSGARAATLNLQVARALTGMLEAAGAQVRLTREGDVALSDVERVQISEAFHAERFLRIGHAAEPPMIGYNFSSAGGRAWALHTRAAFDSLGLHAPPIAEDAQYPLQQTSCPALYVSTARIDAPAAEEHLLSAGTLRSEAYALYL